MELTESTKPGITFNGVVPGSFFKNEDSAGGSGIPKRAAEAGLLPGVTVSACLSGRLQKGR